MGIQQQDEVERKFVVDPEVVLPPLTVVGGVTRLGPSTAVDLHAVYFDTPQLDLHRRGISLRRRSGGEDEGWHLKLPSDGDRRTELRVPLGRSRSRVPARLLDPVRSVVRDRPLHAVASLDTHRVQQQLVGADGVVLAWLCDDTVAGRRLDGTDEGQTWREIEVELVEGTPEVLDAVGAALVLAGATQPPATSKVRRVLGAVDHDEGRRVARHTKRASAREELLAYLEEHIAALHRADQDVRTGGEEGVHRLRIAARQLRAVLTTYEPLMGKDAVRGVRTDLRWLGQAMAGPRDAQVLQDRLIRLVSEQPRDLVLGPVRARVTRDLSATRRAATGSVRTVLRSAEYYRLLDTLDDLLEFEGWAPVAGSRARDVLPDLLRHDLRDVHRAIRRTPPDGPERDAALHEVRKKAKKLRYSAESAVPSLGPRAAVLARRAKEIQTALGEHQDAVMAARMLRRYAAEADADGDSSFTFGRLHALEEERARLAEKAFRRIQGTLPRRHLRRWLRG
ncbi:CYTH and CHAD domain-containing protein [Pedococcus sp. KACC 23699]|uniref:CYTH and CHAD domain-containing protein n=1 Tax=Pedococcus sp. KACC 23699 TaxID=3149228 RepID=A0AAU7JSP3_9MICO